MLEKTAIEWLSKIDTRDLEKKKNPRLLERYSTKNSIYFNIDL